MKERSDPNSGYCVLDMAFGKSEPYNRFDLRGTWNRPANDKTELSGSLFPNFPNIFCVFDQISLFLTIHKHQRSIPPWIRLRKIRKHTDSWWFLDLQKHERAFSGPEQEDGSIPMPPVDQKWWVLPCYKFSQQSDNSRGLSQVWSLAMYPLNQICYVVRAV